MMKGDAPITPGPRDEEAYRVAYLVAGYLRENLTMAEQVELDDWVTSNMANQKLFEELTDPKKLEQWRQWKDTLPTEQVLQRLRPRMHFTTEKQPARIRSWWPYVAAACFIIAAAGFIWMYRESNSNLVKELPAIATVNDLPAGSNRAFLELPDGRKIVLDSIPVGNAIPGLEHFAKQEQTGQLRYNPLQRDPAYHVNYHTLVTPKGGEYQVTLPDGTKVWLNAASSLKYPLGFAGTSRKVELVGEGYFEVAKDSAHPFYVLSGDMRVKVLGTHFNIQAYPNEKTKFVTLAEGVVEVNQLNLKPNEQARFEAGMLEGKKYAVDVTPIIAWTKGQFLFKESTLEEILPQIARWYDAEIDYPSPIPYHFNANIPRSVPISKLLRILEGTGGVHFKVENKKIIVRP